MAYHTPFWKEQRNKGKQPQSHPI